MRTLAALFTLAVAGPAAAQQAWDVAKKAAGGAAVARLEKQVNKRLLEEGRKNQCVFKTDSDAFEKPCGAKLKNLGNALI
ncbi:MAG TPA: OmpA family protein, partial [Anaeromyxobacteraceae bacterium]